MTTCGLRRAISNPTTTLHAHTPAARTTPAAASALDILNIAVHDRTRERCVPPSVTSAGSQEHHSDRRHRDRNYNRTDARTIEVRTFALPQRTHSHSIQTPRSEILRTPPIRNIRNIGAQPRDGPTAARFMRLHLRTSTAVSRQRGQSLYCGRVQRTAKDSRARQRAEHAQTDNVPHKGHPTHPSSRGRLRC